MKRQVIITADDTTQELTMAFVVDGDNIPFKQLPDTEIIEFAQIISVFCKYFNECELSARLQVFNPN